MRQSRFSPIKSHSGEKQPQFGTGRACTSPGCPALLSRYNPGPTCNAHTFNGTLRRRSTA